MNLDPTGFHYHSLIKPLLASSLLSEFPNDFNLITTAKILFLNRGLLIED